MRRTLVLLFVAAFACQRERTAPAPSTQQSGTSVSVAPAASTTTAAPATAPARTAEQVVTLDRINTDADADAAVAVVRDYYAAISARDFQRAYAHWGLSGAPGQPFDKFVAGFEDTRSVDVKTGAPSRIEGAAGSRYIDVPVTITATKVDGRNQRFQGAYTLRRSVVDGAAPSDRVWHFYRAAIRPM